MAKKRGRKGRYATHVRPYLNEITEMRRTMTFSQIAANLGVGLSTFQYYTTIYPELADALKKGEQNLVSDLRGALITRAQGYEYEEKKVVTEEVRWDEDMYMALIDAGFTPAQIKRGKLVKTEVSYKHMPADVASLNLALKNYDKENWSNDPQMLEIRKKELALREKQVENNNW